MKNVLNKFFFMVKKLILRRLKRAQKQSEKTKTFEKAIEDIENANEDQRRLKSLQDTLDKLKYETKPALNETKIVANNRSRPPKVDNNNASLRSRSLSGTRRNMKYSNVKPKIVTRVPLTSRNENESMDESFCDNNQLNLNDSNTIRLGFKLNFLKKLFLLMILFLKGKKLIMNGMKRKCMSRERLLKVLAIKLKKKRRKNLRYGLFESFFKIKINF